MKPNAIILLCILLFSNFAYLHSLPREQVVNIRNQIKSMFYHAYDSYMMNAFPKDELKPLSCSGHDTWGGYTLTLIDALDALVILGNYTEFEKQVKWVSKNMNFDRNVTVSLFETNIRVVGGLLSAHLLASDKSLNIMPSYRGELLPLIVDLADRLLPGRIPFGSINLKYGVAADESKLTSVAGAGTYLLEFGVLSSITGNDKYLNVARKAVEALFNLRSDLDLVGNHINIMTGQWTHRDSGIGGSIDSYFEYLFKAYMLFGDEDYLYMFNILYKAIMKHLYRRPWYIEKDMNKGVITWPTFNSLQGFWPGIQALYGDISNARDTVLAFHAVWRKYGCLPEGWNVLSATVQPGQKGYPLRPELAESLYTLYRVTHDPLYLYMGRDIVKSINYITRVDCGFANVLDVENRTLSDKMESFILAETLKYLYLLFDEENFVNGNDPPFIFNTEGHIIPMKKEYLVKRLYSGENISFNITDTQCKLSELSYFSQNQIGVCELFDKL